jgi:hypothetical protein
MRSRQTRRSERSELFYWLILKPMAPDPKTGKTSTEDKGRLPFEPGSNKKKEGGGIDGPKQAPRIADKPQAGKSAGERKGDRRINRQATLDETRIPDVVSQRMVRRMAVFSGVPSFLGMFTFVAAYFLISQNIYPDLPNVAVVATSLLFLGLGVVGLSYGLLSTSWDETAEGSLLGVEQFPDNFARMKEAWKGARQASLAKRRAEVAAKDEEKARKKALKK